jgi:hypothetical protein
MGGAGGIVEADETYLWKTAQPKPRARGRVPKPTKRGKSGPADKRTIVSLVERGGSVRSFHVENADKMTIGVIVAQNLSREAIVHSDESRIYGDVIGQVAGHERVKHSGGEYVRYTEDGVIHTNSVEGYFGIFKRGMKGVYHYCSEKHLHRYLAEFDFRYNNRVALGVDDAERADQALKGIVGKRLTYRTIN